MSVTKTQPTPRKPSPTPRTSTEERAGDAVRAARPGPMVRLGPGRPATVLACLTVAFLLLAAGATWFALEANRLRAGGPEQNAALVDAETTTTVSKQVSAALESIFSYNYASLDRTRRAAERVLLDEELRKYNAKLSEASKAARERKVVRTASVRAIGVRELHDDKARVLVFLDQQTRTAGGATPTQSTTFLEVVAKKIGGSWKIAKLSSGG